MRCGSAPFVLSRCHGLAIESRPIKSSGKLKAVEQQSIIAISGRVINVNTGIEADPKLINYYPEPSSEGGGWLIKVDVSGASVEGLMDSRECFFSSLTSAFTAYEEMFPRR